MAGDRAYLGCDAGTRSCRVLKGYLFDTNAVAEIRRPRPNPGFFALFQGLPADRLFTTEITIAEIRFGIERSPTPDLRLQLTRWLDEVIRPLIRGQNSRRERGYLAALALMMEEGRRTGYTFPQPDLMLAAIAAHHDLEVISRDVRPFVRAGFRVANPWT